MSAANAEKIHCAGTGESTRGLTKGKQTANLEVTKGAAMETGVLPVTSESVEHVSCPGLSGSSREGWRGSTHRETVRVCGSQKNRMSQGLKASAAAAHLG